MINSGKWTDTDIEQLKVAYTSRKPLKIIAGEFNRTVMSINKALKRFGIRMSKQTAKVEKKAPTTSYYKEKRKPLEPGWNTQHDLIEWLKINNYEVVPLAHLESPFKVNGLKLTPGQLLLTANKLRLQQKLPIFRIVGITND